MYPYNDDPKDGTGWLIALIAIVVIVFALAGYSHSENAPDNPICASTNPTYC